MSDTNNDLSKIDVNRIVTDIAIKDGRIMDAVKLAKRGVQQVLEAERRDEIYGTFTTTTDTYSGDLSTTQVCSPFTPISGEEVGRVP